MELDPDLQEEEGNFDEFAAQLDAEAMEREQIIKKRQEERDRDEPERKKKFEEQIERTTKIIEERDRERKRIEEMKQEYIIKEKMIKDMGYGTLSRGFMGRNWRLNEQNMKSKCNAARVCVCVMMTLP